MHLEAINFSCLDRYKTGKTAVIQGKEVSL